LKKLKGENYRNFLFRSNNEDFKSHWDPREKELQSLITKIENNNYKKNDQQLDDISFKFVKMSFLYKNSLDKKRKVSIRG